MNYEVFQYLSKLNETQSVRILPNVKYNQLALEVPKENYDESLQKEIEPNKVSVQQEEVNSSSEESQTSDQTDRSSAAAFIRLKANGTQ